MTPPTNDELLAACAALGLAPDAQIGWRNVSMTHLSIARFHGAANVNGKRFTYFPADDSLWRNDVVRAIQKARKAVEVAEPVPEQLSLIGGTT